MRLGFTTILACRGLVVGTALCGAHVVAEPVATSDPSPPLAADVGTAVTQPCDLQSIVVYPPTKAPATGSPCTTEPSPPSDIEHDRAYLVETASPGATMLRQRPDLAIGRLHPEFVRRLAGAIREARQVGLSSAGIFSAYRPPAFGVGGFSNKFYSLHTYGLAADMHGIGGSGTPETKLWYEIAGKHGLVCPYGPDNRKEWNHCQPTRVKIILAQSPLRETVTAQGPLNLESMFEVGDAFIDAATGAATAPLDPAPKHVAAADLLALQQAPAHQGMTDKRPKPQITGAEASSTRARIRLTEADHFTISTTSPRPAQLSKPPSWCRHVHRPRQDLCGAYAQAQPATRYRTSSLIKRDSRGR